MKTIKSFFLIMILGLPVGVHAQFASDVLRYSRTEALFDPLQVALSGANIASKSTVSSASQNPAQIALLESSEFSFGFNSFSYQNETEFLNEFTDSQNRQLNLGNLSFGYKVPTDQGSFVFGIGYSQTQNFTRGSQTSLFNPTSTFTDQFPLDSYYRTEAYSAFAIDSLNGDLASIWRHGGNFQGIQQDITIRESGTMGTVNLFLATEFKKDMFIGINVGYTNAGYTYKKEALERDLTNVYTDFELNNDIREIALRDDISAELDAFYLKVGFVYRLNQFVHLAGVFQPRQIFNVEEDFSYLIQTVFDNSDVLRDGFESRSKYRVRTPSRFNLGFSVFPTAMVEFHTNLSYQNFSSSRIDLSGDLFNTSSREQESAINSQIEDTFTKWLGVSTGVVLKPSDLLQVQLGYQWLPHNELNETSDIGIISGGFSYQLAPNYTFDVGARLRQFEDRYFQYFDVQNDYFASEQNIDLAISFGFRLAF